jgi:3-phosphoshikimate 1-carboxyvinyltransferase
LNVKIIPTNRVNGKISAPSSKAQTHRALFTALLSTGITRIINPLFCNDTKATANAITALGAEISMSSFEQSVLGHGRPQSPSEIVDCGESGVTLRFVIPIISLTGGKSRVKGEDTLMRRPIEPLATALKQLGVQIEVQDGLVEISGDPPRGGEVTIRGDVSSQFISGLLLAGTSMKKGLTLKITSPLESRNYVLLTIEALRRHGATVRHVEDMSQLEVPGGQRLSPAVHKITGDFSSASYALAAAAITGSTIVVRNLEKSLEPDSAFIDILSRMGIRTRATRDEVAVEGGRLKSAVVDVKDCPDLGPIIAVLGCYAEGKTMITGAARLRFKESDRLATVRTELQSLGASVTETESGLILEGPVALKGGIVHAHQDHRIAMALSVAALGAQGEVTIEGAECISKSYPNFFEDFRKIGLEAEMVER